MKEELKELTSAQIEECWHATFSTSNPFCPCDIKSFTKAVRWAEARYREKVAALSSPPAQADQSGWMPMEGPSPERAITRAMKALQLARQRACFQLSLEEDEELVGAFHALRDLKAFPPETVPMGGATTPMTADQMMEAERVAYRETQRPGSPLRAQYTFALVREVEKHHGIPTPPKGQA